MLATKLYPLGLRELGCQDINLLRDYRRAGLSCSGGHRNVEEVRESNVYVRPEAIRTTPSPSNTPSHGVGLHPKVRAATTDRLFENLPIEGMITSCFLSPGNTSRNLEHPYNFVGSATALTASLRNLFRRMRKC
jgi:hypothetical protein